MFLLHASSKLMSIILDINPFKRGKESSNFHHKLNFLLPL